MNAQQKALLALLRSSENHNCADCDVALRDDIYGAIHLGVFLCVNCANAHDTVEGGRLSGLKSVLKDTWKRSELEELRSKGGNTVVNNLLERHIPWNWNKPAADADHAVRCRWTKAKYANKMFVLPDYGGEYVSSQDASRPPPPRGLAGISAAAQQGVKLPTRLVDYLVVCGVPDKPTAPLVTPPPSNSGSGQAKKNKKKKKKEEPPERLEFDRAAMHHLVQEFEAFDKQMGGSSGAVAAGPSGGAFEGEMPSTLYDVEDFKIQPSVLDSYPPADSTMIADTPLPKHISKFCFPAGLSLKTNSAEYALLEESKPKIFHFVLTDVNGVRLYATALRITDDCDIAGLTQRISDEIVEDDQALAVAAAEAETTRKASAAGAGSGVSSPDRGAARRAQHRRVNAMLKKAFATSLDKAVGQFGRVTSAARLVAARQGAATAGTSGSSGSGGKDDSRSRVVSAESVASTSSESSEATSMNGLSVITSPSLVSASAPVAGRSSSPAVAPDGDGGGGGGGGGVRFAEEAKREKQEPKRPGLSRAKSMAEAKVVTEKAIVVVSHYPFFELFRHFLRKLYRVSLSESPLPLERFIANFVSEIPLPPRGQVEVKVALPEKVVMISRSPKNELPGLNFSLRPLFQLLSIDNIVTIFGCLLTEAKIALVSRHLSLLTPVASGLLSLLFPFDWQGAFIPVMPKSMIEVLDAPVPFFVGLEASALEGHRRPAEVVYVDLDHDVIDLGIDEETGRARRPTELPRRAETKLKDRLKELTTFFYSPANSSSSNAATSDRAYPNNEHLLPLHSFGFESGLLELRTSIATQGQSLDLRKSASPLSISSNSSSISGQGSSKPASSVSTSSKLSSKLGGLFKSKASSSVATGDERMSAVAADKRFSTVGRPSTANELAAASADALADEAGSFVSERGVRELMDEEEEEEEGGDEEGRAGVNAGGGSESEPLPVRDGCIHDELPSDTERELRAATLRFFVWCFQGYDKYVAVIGADGRLPESLFDRAGFVKQADHLKNDTQAQAALDKLTASQMFDRFVQDIVTEPDRCEVKFFNESIVQKLNRSKTRKALPTPFLDDRSDCLAETFTPPPPSNWGLPEGNTYCYASRFPTSFDKSAFGTVRPPATLIKSAELVRVATAQSMLNKTMVASTSGVAAIGKDVQSRFGGWRGRHTKAEPVSTNGAATDGNSDTNDPRRQLGYLPDLTSLVGTVTVALDRFRAHFRRHMALRAVASMHLAQRTIARCWIARKMRRREAESKAEWGLKVVIVQTCVRKHLSKRRMLRRKAGVVRLQTLVRTRKAVKALRVQLAAVVELQSRFRGYLVWTGYQCIREATIFLQSVERGRRHRQRTNRQRQELLTRLRLHVVSLWHHANTSLVYRSRFWTLFDGSGFLHLALHEDEIHKLWYELGLVTIPMAPGTTRALGAVHQAAGGEVWGGEGGKTGAGTEGTASAEAAVLETRGPTSSAFEEANPMNVAEERGFLVTLAAVEKRLDEMKSAEEFPTVAADRTDEAGVADGESGGGTTKKGAKRGSGPATRKSSGKGVGGSGSGSDSRSSWVTRNPWSRRESNNIAAERLKKERSLLYDRLKASSKEKKNKTKNDAFFDFFGLTDSKKRKQTLAQCVWDEPTLRKEVARLADASAQVVLATFDIGTMVSFADTKLDQRIRDDVLSTVQACLVSIHTMHKRNPRRRSFLGHGYTNREIRDRSASRAQELLEGVEAMEVGAGSGLQGDRGAETSEGRVVGRASERRSALERKERSHVGGDSHGDGGSGRYNDVGVERESQARVSFAPTTLDRGNLRFLGEQSRRSLHVMHRSSRSSTAGSLQRSTFGSVSEPSHSSSNVSGNALPPSGQSNASADDTKSPTSPQLPSPPPSGLSNHSAASGLSAASVASVDSSAEGTSPSTAPASPASRDRRRSSYLRRGGREEPPIRDSFAEGWGGEDVAGLIDGALKETEGGDSSDNGGDDGISAGPS